MRLRGCKSKARFCAKQTRGRRIPLPEPASFTNSLKIFERCRLVGRKSVRPKIRTGIHLTPFLRNYLIAGQKPWIREVARNMPTSLRQERPRTRLGENWLEHPQTIIPEELGKTMINNSMQRRIYARQQTIAKGKRSENQRDQGYAIPAIAGGPRAKPRPLIVTYN